MAKISKEELLEKLQEITENEELEYSSDFKLNHVDSTDLIELSWFIEEKYALYIETDEFSKFHNLNDITKWVDNNA